MCVCFMSFSDAKVVLDRDSPLYLEWSLDNILSPSSKVEVDGQMNLAVGEKEVKKVLLEQNVQGIAEVDIDPDRVEVIGCFSIFT